jgi:2-polyprenyl-6-methoxyphenol hydroxylase-like FAD-dependent oxidoreductase
MRLSRREDDPDVALYADRGKALFLTDRGDYWQCGVPAPKAAVAEMQAKGIEEFRAAIVELAPFLQYRVGELRDWTDLRLLTVRVNRLRQWHRPGLVCIGDAAHAMSPVGGVGINLAIQDAVAAANMLAGPLREGAVSPRDLAKIQRRRAFPTRLTQRVQALIQKRLPCRLRNRVIAVGIRPEHVRTPDVSLAQAGPATHNPKCERSDAG